MYFHDRKEAGTKLAAKLVDKYRYDDTVVLALSNGGVVVGQEIAKVLHARMALLLTEPISLPGLGKDIIGVIDQDGNLTYNSMIPTGELMELVAEMHGYLEEEKMQKIRKMTQMVADDGLMDPQMFYGHNVIIVSDGLKGGMAFEAAVSFLKPIRTKKIVAAIPNVSVAAVDQLHYLSDEIQVLDVLGNYLDTDHYFEDNTIPDVRNILHEVIPSWE